MPKLKINGQEIEVAAGTSILQAAEQMGVEIPRFCYHDRLSVPANCRMCLVELEGAPKPVASCAMACADNMVVHTNSEKVIRSRKGVMETILINHPLDCPICDQGGECDLQDQAVAYGFDRSRFSEDKRAVKDKDLGPLIATAMTRCINCTRCIRFAEEVAGVQVLGQFNRGEDSEIGLFVEGAVESELSGNLVDVCPVGALTSKPYAFSARPWELRKTQTIDVHDALGVNIRVDSRGTEVLRILPSLHEKINQVWIDDRARYVCDGLKNNRIDRPYIRENGALRPASWEEAFVMAAGRLREVPADRIAAYAGDLCDLESMYALKGMMQCALGVENLECRVDGANFDVSAPAGYLFNAGIAAVDDADFILLVGTNLRHEAAVLNARIHKAWRERGVRIALVGEPVDLTYPYHHLGEGPDVLRGVLSEFERLGLGSQKPLVIVGTGAFQRKDGPVIQGLVRKVAEEIGAIRPEDNWFGYCVLHQAASRVGALEIGFSPVHHFHTADMMAVYLLGVDNPETLSEIHKKAFVIYQGHHGDLGGERADVVFPGAAYTEKNGLYVNTEGRLQRAHKVVDPVGEAKDDWAIVRMLSEYLGVPLPYDDLFSLRSAMVEAVPSLARGMDERRLAPWEKFGQDGVVQAGSFVYPVVDFYQTNVITKHSPTLQESSRFFCRTESKRT